MKNQKLYLLILFLSVYPGCGLPGLAIVSSQSQQPYVISVDPVSDSRLNDLTEVNIEFSKSLLRSTVTQDDLFIISKNIYDEYGDDNWSKLSKDVTDEEIAIIEGEIAFTQNDQVVTYHPSQALSPDTEYLIVALPHIQSTDYYPLDQTVTGAVQRQFKSEFLIISEQEADANPSANNNEEEEVNGQASTNDSGTVASNNSETETSSSTTETGSESEIESTEQISQEPQVAFDWNRVLITEVVTDPQQDHNDSSGGNGIHFDATPGTGTIGSTDEYIEIYNGTATPVDLTNWSLSMIDGTDVTQSLNSGWDTFFSQSGSLTNFQSGERLVLGNPTGDIKNTVQILLYNDLNELVDDVDIADSNATSISDEAYSLDESGNWGMSESSLGF